MECRRHRTGPDSDEIPRRRRTGLVRDNQTDLDCGTGRTDERSRAVTRSGRSEGEHHAAKSHFPDPDFWPGIAVERNIERRRESSALNGAGGLHVSPPPEK
jgi:hypothetical protein